MVIIFFGLCGAFISNLTGIPKIHYVPLLISVLVVVLLSMRLRSSRRATQHLAVGAGQFVIPLEQWHDSVGSFHNRSYDQGRVMLWRCLFLYLAAISLIVISPLFAEEKNDYLSYFSTMVLPIFWYCAGPLINPVRIAKGLAALSFLLVFGAIIEVVGVWPGIFPYIGVRLGDVSGQRYGSFTLNPLALGYFAAVTGTLAFCIESRKLRWYAIIACLILFTVANSRGGMVTYAISLAIYWMLRRPSQFGSNREVKLISRILAFVAIVIVAFSIINSPRLSSVFDWEYDEGNLGRLNQWNYCIQETSSSPFNGKGAGAMSVIGLGDQAYIEEGIVKSCDSTILKLGVEYGILIATVYFGLIFYIVVRLVILVIRSRRSMSQGFSDSCIIAPVAVVISIFLQQFFNQTLESIWIGAVFFSLLGYSLSRVSISAIKKSESSTRDLKSKLYKLE